MPVIDAFAAKEQNWRTRNAGSIIRHLLTVDSMKHKKGTSTYNWRGISFNCETSTNARLFPETFMNEQLLVFWNFSESNPDLINRIKLAVEQSNAAALFIPTSNSQTLSRGSCSKNLVELFQKSFGNQLNRENLVTDIRQTLPIFIFCSTGNPYAGAYQEQVKGD